MEGTILSILVQSDTVSNLILLQVTVAFIIWSSDFALYLWLYLIDKHHTLGTCSVSHCE